MTEQRCNTWQTGSRQNRLETQTRCLSEEDLLCCAAIVQKHTKVKLLLPSLILTEKTWRGFRNSTSTCVHAHSVLQGDDRIRWSRLK